MDHPQINRLLQAFYGTRYEVIFVRSRYAILTWSCLTHNTGVFLGSFSDTNHPLGVARLRIVLIDYIEVIVDFNLPAQLYCKQRAFSMSQLHARHLPHGVAREWCAPFSRRFIAHWAEENLDSYHRHRLGHGMPSRVPESLLGSGWSDARLSRPCSAIGTRH